MYNVTFEEMKQAIFEFKLYLVGRSGSFTTCLYKTIISADLCNQSKMARAFPSEVLASVLYHNGPIANIYRYYALDSKHLDENNIFELLKLFDNEDKLKKDWCLPKYADEEEQ